MHSEALAVLFARAAEVAVDLGLLPKCEWSEWVFKPQADRRRGDFATATVLSTAHRYMQATAQRVDIDQWNDAVISCAQKLDAFPDWIERISATKGHINVWTTGDQRAPSADSFPLRPIGYMETCFWEKFGTPRQSD